MTVKRFIGYGFLTLIGLYCLILLIALVAEKQIHNKYKANYNAERIKKGIYPIDKFEKVTDDYWSDFIPTNSFERWFNWILINREIGTTTTYENSGSNFKPYHESKIIYYGVRLFFWQNIYGGEMDVFIKPLEQNKYIAISVIYFSEQLEPEAYFYAKLDTIDESRPKEIRFICGSESDGHIEHENRKIQGNITKEQADKILNEWGLKIK